MVLPGGTWLGAGPALLTLSEKGCATHGSPVLLLVQATDRLGACVATTTVELLLDVLVSPVTPVMLAVRLMGPGCCAMP